MTCDETPNPAQINFDMRHYLDEAGLVLEDEQIRTKLNEVRVPFLLNL